MGQNGETRIQAGSLIGLALMGASQLLPADVLPVWTAGHPVWNDIGGSFGGYAPPDCMVNLSFSAGASGSSGRSLEIRYSNPSSAPCGFYTHLFNEREPRTPRSYIDLVRYPWLTFKVRGALTPELRIADGALYRIQDSVKVGRLSEIAGEVDSKGWRNVAVSTANLRLRAREAAVLSLSFPSGSSGTLAISDVYFKRDPGLESPAPAPPPKTADQRSTLRAMWYWEFGDCLADELICARAFALARQNRIGTIFAQVSYRCEGEEASAVCTLNQPERLRMLLRSAKRAGLRIHALEGAPEYALARHHPAMKALVRAVLDFNRASPPDSRFAGIHFDIEPYLLLGFHTSARSTIMRDYLVLHRDVMGMLKDAGTERIEFGADIPFWYDEPEGDGQNPNVISFDGRSQELSRHLIDLLDNVVLMDYRNTALGSDGIIKHGMGEIEYAKKAGKRVLIGVETLPQKAEPGIFLAGMAERQWREETDNPLLFERSIDGFRLRSFTDGETRYLGLAPGTSDPNAPRFRSALETLASRAGIPQLSPEARDTALEDARTAVERSGEYSSFNLFGLRSRAAFRVTSVSLEKLSFAGQTRGAMQRVLETVEEYFGQSTSFGGIAIHSFASWLQARE
jgi:hypothetical protein